MKTQEETQKLFESLSAEERAHRVAIAYDADTVYLNFGSLPDPGINLTPEQIKGLPVEWQERFVKAEEESAIKDCVLLAGEETEIVTSGSLYFCKQHVGQLPYKNLPRDPYSGKGCWVISRKGETLAEGYFDKDVAY